MASSLITDYTAAGLLADRPAVPEVAPGVMSLWYATDTGVLSAWDGDQWRNITEAGIGVKQQVLQRVDSFSADGVTFDTPPLAGNLLVAAIMRVSTGRPAVGEGWVTIVEGDSGNGTANRGVVKIAGADESATQFPSGTNSAGYLAAWEIENWAGVAWGGTGATSSLESNEVEMPTLLVGGLVLGAVHGLGLGVEITGGGITNLITATGDADSAMAGYAPILKTQESILIGYLSATAGYKRRLNLAVAG